MTCVEYYWRNDTLQGLTNEQQFHANLFWCNVFYSILSLPFCLVKLFPGALALLTHTTVTGYNAHGACVPFCLRSSTRLHMPGGPPAWTVGLSARIVIRLLRLAEQGRLARGVAYDAEVQVRDIVAGMFHRTVGFCTRQLYRKARGQAQEDDIVKNTKVPVARPPANSNMITWGLFRQAQEDDMVKSKKMPVVRPPANSKMIKSGLFRRRKYQHEIS